MSQMKAVVYYGPGDIRVDRQRWLTAATLEGGALSGMVH